MNIFLIKKIGWHEYNIIHFETFLDLSINRDSANKYPHELLFYFNMTNYN